MARIIQYGSAATGWLWAFGFFLVMSLAESAWHVRDSLSAKSFLWDWLPHLIALVLTAALLLVIAWRQTKPDKSIVKLELSGDRPGFELSGSGKGSD